MEGVGKLECYPEASRYMQALFVPSLGCESSAAVVRTLRETVQRQKQNKKERGKMGMAFHTLKFRLLVDAHVEDPASGS